MADNLIFRIGFDLESGVQDAIKKGDVALRQIQAAMSRKPIALKAEVDASKFHVFSRQFTNSIDGISAKLAQAHRLWNAMPFDKKFDADGNLSRRAQIVFDAFQQLTQASITMGQRLGDVNRSLAKSEQDTARAITAEYDKRQRQVNEQIRLKERQAAAEERVRQGQLKGVNAGYVDTQRQVEAVRNLRLQYEAILPMLNAMAQRRYDIKVGIDKQFEADIQRINAEIARLRQSNLQLGAKGDANAIQANLQAIRQLETELQRISQQKIDLLNSNKINSDLARLRTEISSTFGELQNAERRLASDNSLNTALDAQSQKVLKLHADIQKLDQQFAQLNATGKAYNQDGSFTAQANTLLQQRIALTKQLEQEAITGQQAQIKLEQQLREEKRQTEQAAKNSAKEAERQAKAEAAARKQAQDAANAENKARQEAYNARRRQGQETQRILNKEAKSIADITAKLQIQQQRLQSANIGSAKFNKIAEEVRRLTADLEKANQKMRELTGQTQSGAARQSAAVRQVSQEFKHQDGYVSRLLKRLAVYASFSYASQFLTSIREVTAQFELQRVSLGAIIQDTSRANQLWSEIKTFALKSPVKILDLTKYTKQVAAYGVETDKLFDTTKRIMDISVGLGVDASRLVLAYGQVKAASYLRAAEIRQFTEAGIPMLELLAEKFTELNGKAVTTEQVMDMVSKRMVGFDMVEQIFKDMTSAGGMFFDMQEKQGNTLFGLWAKLGDAASIMYDEIGNTDLVNSAMKDSIQFLTDLMKNWQLVGGEVAVASVAIGLIIAKTKTQAVATALQAAALNKIRAAGITYNALLAEEARLQKIGTAAQLQSVAARKANAKAALDAAIAEKTAAASTNIWTRSMQKLKAAFMGNWITLLIAGLAAIGVAIYNAVEKANKLKNELKEIGDAGRAESAKNVFNFERLANAALEAATGSREQKEALDELKRTYGDIIPAEQLSLENLQKLRAQGYEPLTAAIKEYIAQRTLQKEIDAITSHYTEDTIAKQRQLRELFKRGSIYSFFKGTAWSPIGNLDDDQISQVFANVDKLAQDKSKSWEDVWVEAIRGVTDVSKDAEKKMRNMFVNETQNAQQQSYNNMMRNIVENTRGMADETDTATKKMETHTGAMGKYKQTLDETSKSLANLRLLYANGKEVDVSSFLGKQMVSNASIKAWKDDIVENLQDAGIAIKNEWFNIIANLNPTDATKISSINFASILEAINTAEAELGDKFVPLKNSILKYQELYNGIVPSDRTVSAMRSRLMLIAGNIDKTGGIMNDLQRHLMKSGDNWENYSKSVRDAVKDYEAQIDEMKKINASIKKEEKGVGPLDPSKYSDEEIKKVQLLVEALKQLFPFLAPEKSSGGGRTSDPRLQNLKEEISLVQKLYNEYKQLEKQEGATKAAADMRRMAGDTLDMFKSKYNIDLPTDAKDLTAALEVLYKKMAALPKKVFPSLDKDLKELRWTIEKVDIDESQKNIEAELKRLSDRLSRTKTAKEFYEKILGMTGDYDLAAKVSLSIYGDTGYDLQKQLAEQVRQYFQNDQVSIEIPVDVITADNQINYKRLGEFAEQMKEKLGEEPYKAIKKIAEQGQKDLAKTYEGYLKDLEKAKTYADKRIELARYTANKIAEINASALPQAEKDRLTAGYREREQQKRGELEWEAFKDMPIYVQMFDDLDNASGTMLSNMKAKLLELQSVWGSALNPTQLKELQSRLSEIDAQLAKKNPFKTLSDAMKQYRALSKGGTQADAERKLIEVTDKRQAAQQKLNMALDVSRTAQERYNEAVSKYGADSEQAKNAKLFWDAAKSGVEDAGKLVEQTGLSEKEAQRLVAAWKKVKDAIGLSLSEVFQIAHSLGDLAGGIGKLTEVFGGDEEDVQYWNDIAAGLNEVTSGIENMVQAAISGNPIGIVTSAITAIPNMISGFANLFSAGKVRKANKEIKRQQELLEQLEYTYGRLENAADKVFGADYISNYNAQMRNLQAQAAAYRKQAEAERSKGKDADEAAIQQYENSYRDTMDKIADMQSHLAEQMTGTDVASAARDFAKAWLEAYATFGNTTDAIKEKFNDMIKYMIVESVMAKTVQMALQPMFDEMSRMYQSGKSMTDVLTYAFSNVGALTQQINDGLMVNAKHLEAVGVNIRDLYSTSDNLSGISKNIASATSEEINTAAAIGNTLMYYAAPIPRIDENLARVVALMEGRGASATPQTTSAGWTDWQQQAMDNYNAIARNTADTVVECRRAAEACERIASTFKVKGSTKGLNVFLNT